jgi:hypothetical protein
VAKAKDVLPVPKRGYNTGELRTLSKFQEHNNLLHDINTWWTSKYNSSSSYYIRFVGALFDGA